MNPVASPRHPWKAFAAVIAVFALVHGAGAHVFSHGHDRDHDHTRIVVGHALTADADCDDVDTDVEFGPNFPFDDVPDPFDHDFD